MKKRKVLQFGVLFLTFVVLLGVLHFLQFGGLTGFVILGPGAELIFSDDFEDGDLAGWTLTSIPGANDWTNSNVDPFEDLRHAQSQPQDTTTPASVMERIVSTEGYESITFVYYR